MDENEAREGLEDALNEEPEPSHGETEQSTQATDTDETKGTKKGPGPVPYQRFKEVNERLHSLEEALDAKNQELEERASALSKLSTVLEAKEQAAGYIDKIRELYRSGDPQWAPVLEKLDRRLAGIEEEVETGDKTEKEAADETRQILKATTAKLEDAILDQRADLIVGKADTYAAQLLDQLPDEYTDNDRRRIAHYLNEAVDWEAIENANDWQQALEGELPRAFEYVLNEIYGEPEGVIAQKLQEELKATGQVKTPEPTPEERLERLQSRDWSKFKVDKTDSGRLKSFAPESSDDEFSQAMADALRAANEVATRSKKA